MALINVGEDPWLLELESCEKLCRDIMEQLTLRQRYPRSSEKFSQLSASTRIMMKQYSNEVNQLKAKLDESLKGGEITTAEAERRFRQTEILLSKGEQIQKTFNGQTVQKANADRSELMGNNSIWGPSSSSATSVPENATVTDLRNEQKKMLNEQEAGLENLSQIIARQKNIAHTISTEVDFHNEILDDIDTQVDRTDTRVRAETEHVGVVGQKDKTCVLWVIIILLFICIIIVGTV